ncbi:hypothetical protein ACFL52_01545 [Candidatus Margulisiibacteriota bacterium]
MKNSNKKRELFKKFVNKFSIVEKRESIVLKKKSIREKLKELICLFDVAKGLKIKSDKNNSNQMLRNNWNLLKTR